METESVSGELKTLNELYGYLRLYVNFFQPVMKLKDKRRVGSRIIKKHDEPKTPYQRVIESEDIEGAVKRRLKKQYEALNPAEIKRAITKLQDKLIRLATSKIRKKQDDFE